MRRRSACAVLRALAARSSPEAWLLSRPGGSSSISSSSSISVAARAPSMPPPPSSSSCSMMAAAGPTPPALARAGGVVGGRRVFGGSGVLGLWRRKSSVATFSSTSARSSSSQPHPVSSSSSPLPPSAPSVARSPGPPPGPPRRPVPRMPPLPYAPPRSPSPAQQQQHQQPSSFQPPPQQQQLPPQAPAPSPIPMRRRRTSLSRLAASSPTPPPPPPRAPSPPGGPNGHRPPAPQQQVGGPGAAQPLVWAPADAATTAPAPSGAPAAYGQPPPPPPPQQPREQRWAEAQEVLRRASSAALRGTTEYAGALSDLRLGPHPSAAPPPLAPADGADGAGGGGLSLTGEQTWGPPLSPAAFEAEAPPPPAQPAAAKTRRRRQTSAAATTATTTAAAPAQARSGSTSRSSTTSSASSSRSGGAAQAAEAAAHAAASAAPRWGVEVVATVKSVTHEGANGFKIVRATLQEQARDAPDAGRAKLKAPRSASQRAPGAVVVLLGQLPTAAVGVTVVVRGFWDNHERHGWQVKVVEAEERAPRGFDSVRAYLEGCLSGVGPKTAARIVEAIGSDRVVDVLNSDSAVAELSRVPAVGASKAKAIKEQWDRNEGARAHLVFLGALGLAPAAAHRVAQRHGGGTEDAVREDPYSALQAVPGVYSWRTAEAVAAKLGHDPASASRGGAALLQVLGSAAAAEGHTRLTWASLRAEALRLLGASDRPWPAGPEGLVGAAREQRRLGRLVIEAPGATGPALEDEWSDDATFMATPLWRAEADVTSLLLEFASRHREFEANLRAGEGGGEGEGKKDGAVVKKGSKKRLSAAAKKAAADAAAVRAWLDAYERGQSREEGRPVKLSEGQRVAIETAVLAPACILTGGPGCGKTFATRAVARYWHERGERVALCAPTGRAAQRLQEIVGLPGMEASTVHRLLGYKGGRGRGGNGAGSGGSGSGSGAEDAPGAAAAAAAREDVDALTGGGASSGANGGGDGDAAALADLDDELDLAASCAYGRRKPLPFDCVLLDEASMMDLPLAAALFNAIDRRRTRLVIVGDADQLPPVGPGAPLRAAVASRLLPVVDLRQVFRQSGKSAIVRGAHAINSGRAPDLETWRVGAEGEGVGAEGGGLEERLAALRPRGGVPGAPLEPPSDALMLELPPGASAEDVERCVARAVEVLVPALGWDASRDVQVLSPVRRGAAGVGALNQRLQPLVNPPDPRRAEMPLSAHPTANAAAAAAAAAAGLPPPVWRVGDRVLQTSNDYERSTWNGDLGYVAAVDASKRSLTVRFPQALGGGGGGGAGGGDGTVGSSSGSTSNSSATAFEVLFGAKQQQQQQGQQQHEQQQQSLEHQRGRFLLYSGQEVSEQLQLAWATTVHKSQGGEYPVVVLALHRAFGASMLSRPLLYTAMTRARRLLVVVGTGDVLAAAAARAGGVRKQMGLGDRLAQGARAAGIEPCEPRIFRDDASDDGSAPGVGGGRGGNGGGGGVEGQALEL